MYLAHSWGNDTSCPLLLSWLKAIFMHYHAILMRWSEELLEVSLLTLQNYPSSYTGGKACIRAGLVVCMCVCVWVCIIVLRWEGEDDCMCKHAPALGHFCSPDNINSAYHITIKARGEQRGRLNTVQFRSSLQINHRVAWLSLSYCKRLLAKFGEWVVSRKAQRNNEMKHAWSWSIACGTVLSCKGTV